MKERELKMSFEPCKSPGEPEKGRICKTCSLRCVCDKICAPVEELLPSMEQGRIDFEDLPRIWRGKIVTRAILDNTELLTGQQQKVVQLYYRDSLLQRQIGVRLGITQQAVGDHLRRIREKIGSALKISQFVADL